MKGNLKDVSLLIDVFDSNNYDGDDNYDNDDNGDRRRDWRWFTVCVLILRSVAVSQVYRFYSCRGFVNGSYSVTELTWSHATEWNKAHVLQFCASVQGLFGIVFNA